MGKDWILIVALLFLGFGAWSVLCVFMGALIRQRVDQGEPVTEMPRLAPAIKPDGNNDLESLFGDDIPDELRSRA